MKATYTLLLFALFLAACGAAETEPPATAPPEADEEVVADVAAPTDTALPASPTAADEPLAPTAVPTAEAPTDSAASAGEEATEPVADEPDPAESEPAEAAIVNGPYEGTYFRGSADAPVTILDYSDFL